jgi:peptide/nickel transport system substrate-binding protein
MSTAAIRARSVVLTLIATTMVASIATAGVAPALTKKKPAKKPTTTKAKAKATTTVAKPAATVAPAPATTVAAGTTIAAKPAAPSGKVGEQLTLAIAAAPNSLNPALANVGTANLAINPIYASLLYMKSDRSYAGDIAEKWGYTDPFNEQFEMTIRAGLKFADGSPLDANAVAASLNYYLKNGLNRTAWLTTVTSITASGNKVIVKATGSTPDLERVFSSDKLAGAIISPAGLADPSKMATASYGAGAYVLDASGTTPGSQYTMVPNKNYWDATQQHWKKIVIKVVPDNNAVIQAMQTGQIDFTTQLTGANLSAAKAAGLNIDTAAGASFFALLADRNGDLNSNIGDLKIRQAMNMALDRPAICKAVFGDAAIPMYQLQAKGMDGYDPEIDKLYPYDLAKAKALMAQSVSPNGFKLSIEAANQAGFNVLGQAVAQQWKAIGIDVDITNSPNVPAGQALHAQKKFSVYITANGLNSTPLLAGLHIFSPGNRFNPWSSADPGINDVLKQGFATAAPESEKLYRKAWRRYMDQAWAAPVCTSLGIIATTKGVSGWQVPEGGNTPSVMDLFPS